MSHTDLVCNFCMCVDEYLQYMESVNTADGDGGGSSDEEDEIEEAFDEELVSEEEVEGAEEDQGDEDVGGTSTPRPPSIALDPAPDASPQASSSSPSRRVPLELHPTIQITSPAADAYHADNGILSPMCDSRPLSRSPPASRHTSPLHTTAASSSSHSSHSSSRSQSPLSSLADRTAALSLSSEGKTGIIRERAAAEAATRRARQQRKYHSKRGAQKAGGRQKGSKAKMDTRVKPDKGGFWD